MGKKSRDKGNRVERSIVNVLKSHGFNAERTPLSGALNYHGKNYDIDSDCPLAQRIEVKSRREFPQWLSTAVGKSDAVILRADRAEPLILLHLSRYLDYISGKSNDIRDQSQAAGESFEKMARYTGLGLSRDCLLYTSDAADE